MRLRLRPSRQAVIVSSVILIGLAAAWREIGRPQCPVIAAGFWFEAVTHTAGRLGGAVTPEDIETIRSVARNELDNAFSGLNITFSDDRDARYRVHVVQELRDLRFQRPVWIPAESRVLPGFGGGGAVSFSWLASGAVAYAPDDAERHAIVEAIGRGIGRAAVHEFVHQFIPSAQIHDSRDVGSYEYRSAARREQFFGEMRWNLARPLLEQRFGSCSAAAAS